MRRLSLLLGTLLAVLLIAVGGLALAAREAPADRPASLTASADSVRTVPRQPALSYHRATVRRDRR